MIIENPMLSGNWHDSTQDTFLDYCAGCGGEIAYGEPYRYINGDYLHDNSDCKAQYIDDCSTGGIAGEE